MVSALQNDYRTQLQIINEENSTHQRPTTTNEEEEDTVANILGQGGDVGQVVFELREDATGAGGETTQTSKLSKLSVGSKPS
jgi:hypothetical protein